MTTDSTKQSCENVIHSPFKRKNTDEKHTLRASRYAKGRSPFITFV